KRSPAGAAGVLGPELWAAIGVRQAESRREGHGPLRALVRRRSLPASLEDQPRVVGAHLDEAGWHVDRHVRVMRIEDVAFFDLFARRVDVLPGGDPCDLPADDVRRTRLQVQREQRYRRVVWYAHLSAAQRD